MVPKVQLTRGQVKSALIIFFLSCCGHSLRVQDKWVRLGATLSVKGSKSVPGPFSVNPGGRDSWGGGVREAWGCLEKEENT